MSGLSDATRHYDLSCMAAERSVHRRFVTHRPMTKPTITLPRHALIGAALIGALTLAPGPAAAQQVLNLYTARHYATDEALYASFSRQTGIKVNRIEGGEDALFERIRAEGANSPADVFITADVGRLWQADQAGLFAPVTSAALESRIAPHFRDPAAKWFGFSARARIIVYDKSRIKPGEINDYEDLADPRWKKQICTRSGAHPYMLSLTASMVAHGGEEKAAAWVKGLVSNLARAPKGGDTDQIRGAASGECAIAVTNQYYLVRLMRSNRAEDQAAVARLGMVWPNQANRGTHMNISGGGMLRHAPNRDSALKFLEFLASDDAQAVFASGNNEWPTVPGVKLENPALASLGTFKQDALPAAKIGANQPAAQRIADRMGFK